MDQCAKLAEEVRIAAAAAGLTVQNIALRSGTSWWTARRVLDGDPSVTVQTLASVLEGAGLDLVLRAYPGHQPLLRDRAQLRLVQQLRAESAGAWQAAMELNIGPHGEAIDLVLFGASEIIACEVERRITDWQAQFRRADAKRVTLAGRHQRPVRLVLAVEDTRRNRETLRANLPAIRAAVPAGTREVMAALRQGRPIRRDGLVWVRPRGDTSQHSARNAREGAVG